jgi:hypothetical protein
MIEIIFTVLIGILFFWDLVIFYKKKNLRLHRILVPIGLLGSLAYIYISHEKLDLAIKNSLGILITSLLAFLIIIAIKLFLTKNELKKIDSNEEKEIIKCNNIDIDELLEKLNTNNNINSFEKKLTYLSNKIENLEQSNNSNLIEKINEIKESIEFWMKRFDEDSKLFHNEAMAIKNENKKQLSLILKLLTMSSNKFNQKIELFENKLDILEHKKITIDDNIINNIIEKTQAHLNYIKIELSNIQNSFNEIYSKETNTINYINEIESTFNKIDNYLNNLSKSFEKIDVIDDKLIYTLNEFNNVKKEYENIIQNFSIPKENQQKNILNKLNELEMLLKNIENCKESKPAQTTINKNDIALKNYQKNLK